ncbi:MAG: hypothetical protein ACRDF7_03860 [Candidatus Limnocylindrales bacterium]
MRVLSAPLRLAGLVVGIVLMAVGTLLTMTSLLAFLGVPLLVVGVLLTLRSFF